MFKSTAQAGISFAVLVLAVAACSNGGPSPVAASSTAPPTPTMTITIGAATSFVGVQVRYTCIQSDKIATCGPESVSGVWTKKLTVPVGTVVRVQASGNGAYLPPSCWIADETDHLVFNKSDNGSCQAEIK